MSGSAEKIIINMSDVDEVISKTDWINSIPLSKLYLLGYDGRPLILSEEDIEEWEAIGLSNIFMIKHRLLGTDPKNDY